MWHLSPEALVSNESWHPLAFPRVLCFSDGMYQGGVESGVKQWVALNTEPQESVQQLNFLQPHWCATTLLGSDAKSSKTVILVSYISGFLVFGVRRVLLGT